MPLFLHSWLVDIRHLGVFKLSIIQMMLQSLSLYPEMELQGYKVPISSVLLDTVMLLSKL